jgi:hypothetical protein
LELKLLSSCRQGGTDRPRPCARYGAEVRHVRAHEAALVEGVEGSRGCCGGERATARCG